MEPETSGSNVRFEADEQYTPRPESVARGGLLQWLVDKGIAKDTQQASYILLGVAGAVIVVAFIVPLFFGHSGPKAPPSAVNAAMQITHPVSR